MPSEKHLARKISLISTSVFALFLICLVIFTRFFLIHRERIILESIDTAPIEGMTFWEGSMISEGSISILHNTWSLMQWEILPEISIGSPLPLIGIPWDAPIPMVWWSVTVSTEAGLIFESLRDSIVIQEGKEPIKNWLFYFIDIQREDLVWKPEYFSMQVWEKAFLFRKITKKNVVVFISRDITNIESLTINLIKLSIGAIIIFVIAIYFLSRFFAQLTMSPIRKNNTLLREFNHSLAHEIKTPLSVIRLNLETLKSKTKSSLISSAVEEVDTISSITDAMLFISEWTILRESEDIKLSCYIRWFIERYYPWMIDITGTSEKSTKVTPILLDRILINICENAIKYGEWKPTIQISDNVFSIENKTKREIDNTSLQKLGTPFFQVHTENRKTGNWLGLCIIKKIIELLWWRISFSYKDKIFCVTIHISEN